MLSNLEMETLANVLNQNYFDHYVKFAHNGQYEHFRHTKLVCKYLQRIPDGEELAFMIEMLPRHGKSMTATESFPSVRNPEKRVITASYSDNLAKNFGRKNKDKFKEFAGPLNNLNLSKTNAAVKDWGIEGHSGGMLSTGVGGSITGQGADLNPIKNQQDASSETIREKIWDGWDSTLSTRLSADAFLSKRINNGRQSKEGVYFTVILNLTWDQAVEFCAREKRNLPELRNNIMGNWQL